MWVIVSALFAMTLPIAANDDIPELLLPSVPDTIRVPADRADYVMRHFWDAMDFADNTITHNNVFMEQNVVNYLSLLPHAHQDKLPTIIDSFLDTANTDGDTYSIIYDLAGKYLNNSDSPMRNEEYYILFLNHAVNKGNLNEAERARAAFKLEMAMKNRPGTKAPDFSMMTREGDTETLSETLTDGNNVILFYDPDCNHCAEVIDYLQNAPQLKGIKVIAVDSEEDHYLWEATKDQLPDTWTVGFALDPIQDTEQYVFPEMPTIYLIDGNGTILLKEATMENLLNHLQ